MIYYVYLTIYLSISVVSASPGQCCLCQFTAKCDILCLNIFLTISVFFVSPGHCLCQFTAMCDVSCLSIYHTISVVSAIVSASLPPCVVYHVYLFILLTISVVSSIVFASLPTFVIYYVVFLRWQDVSGWTVRIRTYNLICQSMAVSTKIPPVGLGESEMNINKYGISFDFAWPGLGHIYVKRASRDIAFVQNKSIITQKYSHSRIGFASICYWKWTKITYNMIIYNKSIINTKIKRLWAFVFHKDCSIWRLIIS